LTGLPGLFGLAAEAMIMPLRSHGSIFDHRLGQAPASDRRCAASLRRTTTVLRALVGVAQPGLGSCQLPTGRRQFFLGTLIECLTMGPRISIVKPTRSGTDRDQRAALMFTLLPLKRSAERTLQRELSGLATTTVKNGRLAAAVYFGRLRSAPGTVTSGRHRFR
jgi:hypothetical protein